MSGARGGPSVQGEAVSDSPTPEPTQRLFFAFWPTDEEQQALVRAVAKGVRASGGRPVPAQNLHVTLAFLGSVPLRRVPELRASAQLVAEACAWQGPLVLRFTHLVHWAQSQILCALGAAEDRGTVRGADALASALKDQAAAAGFSPDLKPFRAHVTVARKVVRATRSLEMRSVEWSSAGFALIESRTRPEGAVYSVIESYPINKVRVA